MLNGGVASMRFWTASGVRQLAVSSTHIATVRPMAIAAERMTGVRVRCEAAYRSFERQDALTDIRTGTRVASGKGHLVEERYRAS
jgi:hypothetical protein